MTDNLIIVNPSHEGFQGAARVGLPGKKVSVIVGDELSVADLGIPMAGKLAMCGKKVGNRPRSLVEKGGDMESDEAEFVSEPSNEGFLH